MLWHRFLMVFGMEENSAKQKEVELPNTPDPPQIINPSSATELDQKRKPVATTRKKSAKTTRIPAKKKSAKKR